VPNPIIGIFFANYPNSLLTNPNAKVYLIMKNKEGHQMPNPNPENIKRAIEDVQQAYDELNAQWLAKLKEADEIKESLGKLEAFLNPAKALLSMGEESQSEVAALPKVAPLPPPSSIPPMSLIEKPILQGAIEILKEAGHPMHLADIAKEFYKRRWKLSQDNGREVLRYTFRKHIGPVFVKTKTGKYDLKEPNQPALAPKLIRRAMLEPPKEQ
jgi:hypothetical protein